MEAAKRGSSAGRKSWRKIFLRWVKGTICLPTQSSRFANTLDVLANKAFVFRDTVPVFPNTIIVKPNTLALLANTVTLFINTTVLFANTDSVLETRFFRLQTK